MNGPRLLVPVISALCGLAFTGTAAGSEPSCVVDVEAALAGSPKTTDTIPLAEGAWIGEVYVLPYSYPGTYDRHLPGGLDNIQARQWVAQSFFAHNPDAYDFIAVVTGFGFDAGWGQLGDPAHALYWGIKNDTSGLGLDFFDLSQAFGSARLHGYIDANHLELVRNDEGALEEDLFLTILSHELGHRWLAYCDYEDDSGAVSSDLRGVDDGHWSYLLDSDASYMYGADWHDNGDGSFTSTEIKERFSELDLYLMGMVPADEVEPFNLLVNPTVPADQYPELGATVTAVPTSVTIQDVIAAEGHRNPAAADAPHELRIALVYLTAPGIPINNEEFNFLTAARKTWQRRFFAQTEGRGVIGVGRNSLPVASPSTVDLAAAVNWLLTAADGAGLWQDHPTTRGRDSASVITALDTYGGHAAEIATGLDALAAASADATEIEAWRTEPLAHHGHSAAPHLLDQLSSWVLDEGAWGGGLRYAGDTVSTGRVVRALAAGGRVAETVRALSWIGARQNPDGGWGWRAGGPSSTAPTLEAIGAAIAADPLNWSDPSLQNAVTWLLGHRTRGGFGDPHPDTAQTALFLAAVRGQAVSRDIIDDAISFLATRQRSDGSWGGSAYQTAQAVTALTPYLQLDLAVSSSQLLIDPESPFVDDQLTLRAAVHALNGDVPAGLAYRWEVMDASQNVIATLNGVLPPIPATLFATVVDSWNLQHHVSPGPTTFRFTADSLLQIAESDESNNTAELPVVFREHTHQVDLVLSPDAIHATPDVITTLPQTVVIDGVVQNTSRIDVHDAVVSVFESGSTTPLASTNVTVLLDTETPFQLTIQLAEARPYQLAVIADPDNLLNDFDPGDNRVDLEIGVAPAFDPAVVSGSLIVNPAAGAQAGDVLSLEFETTNLGTVPVSGIQIGVSFTAGSPAITTPIQLVDLIGDLDPGEIRTLTLDWRPPVADPDLALTIEIDPSHLVNDADRSNNTAEINIAVEPSPLPNLVASHTTLTFDPDPALQHDTVRISTAIANPTDNASGPFVVQLWIDEIGSGILAGESTVVDLAAGGTTMVEADWLVDEMADRVVWIDVDATGQVAEFNEDDNRDFGVLDIHTIPDLVVTSGQVTLDPRFPRTGDLVHLEIAVLNTGDQSANDVELELGVAGGGVIGAVIVPIVVGGDQATVAFDWPTDGIVGDLTLRATADPSNAVAENDESNNTADLLVSVQDADLWVTERYISPNGDGVKDQTLIFVRESTATIDVIDPWGELVRSLDVTPGGEAVWDGRTAGGAAVRDGVYELSAGGLGSWVEVDLNGVTITDDVRQRLITGNVPTSSTHWDAEFTSFTASPVDGIVYITEKLGGFASPSKMWRWNGERLEDVPGWPDGHWRIHEISAHEDVFITKAFDYSLIRFPGPRIDALPPPSAEVDEPHLSPDGVWILWTDTRRNQVEKPIVLQRTGDLSETFELGPFPSGSNWSCNDRAAVHWAPGGGRVVVALHRCSSISVVTIEFGSPPVTGIIDLDVRCESQSPWPTTTAIDLEQSRLTCIDDNRRLLSVVDLQSRETLDEVALPNLFQDQFVWYRLTNDARAVEIDAFYPPDLKGDVTDEPTLYDWRRDLSRPWITAGFGQPPVWSSHDRYAYSAITSWTGDHFTYDTPAANLAVTLDPVVRFGGSGIDLFLTVTDKNLDHYRLDYAPASDPDAFEPLGQPARGTIFGENRGTWIPPAQGDWRIRLTAVDLAGNQRSTTRWVSWNGANDIAGLWTDSRYISPVASPGIQDELVWQYTVLRPAQLVFEIVDATGALIRRIPVGASLTGPATSTWDGLDDAGRPVPDGDYTLVFRGAEWPVTVDNTPPALSFEIAANGHRPTPQEIAVAASWDPPVDLLRSAIFNLTSWSAADENLTEVVFESRHLDGADWAPIAGTTLFAGVTESESREAEVRSEWWAERVVRQVATDRSGNRSVAERLHREEQLAVAIAEPPCRNDEDPCLYPNRPDVDSLGDADGLMDDDVAVLWPGYSTLLVQSTVWGDWRNTLRLEFRVPAEGGFPVGDWQPGSLTAADDLVWRRSTALSGPSSQDSREFLTAKVLPVYWEHQGLPLRPYEIRLTAENRDGVEITTPTVLMVPKAPLMVEYLTTDAGGDHFRVQNIGTTRIDNIVFFGGRDTLSWWRVADVGSLDPGHSTLVNTGCAFLDTAIGGITANWIRVEGLDPWGAAQSSLPAPFMRAGPSVAISRPNFSLIRSSCSTGSPAAVGMMGYNMGISGPTECTTWSCELGWRTPGTLVDLQVTVPDTDPNGTPIAGYELLLDGNVLAGTPDLTPGTTGRVVLDLTGLTEGPHVVGERYLFAPGAQGMLAGCTQTATLHVDRSATVEISRPTDGQVLCPDQGAAPVVTNSAETPWQTTLLIDGSTTGITTDPASIVVSALDPGAHLLNAELVDLAGNAACASVEFFTESVAAISDLEIDPPVFSPTNTTGRPVQTIVSFASTANAGWTVEIRDDFDEAVRDQTGEIIAGESVSLSWDGRDFDGALVDDGTYGIWIRLESACGAVYETPTPLPTITIDTEAPSVVVTNPWPGAPIGTGIELRALITDPTFDTWEARLSRPPPYPADPMVIGTGDQPSTDPNNVLVRWPAAHLESGNYILVVEATDTPGNRAITDEIPLWVQNLQLIASYEVNPIYISPNGDGLADTADFKFELLQEAEINLEFEGFIRLIEFQVLPPGIVHIATWGGLDPDSNPVPDGPYTFILDAYDPNFGEGESDYATVIIDRIPPTVTVASPSDGSLIALPVTVSGASSDLHADTHTINLLHPDGSTTELASDSGDWMPDQSFDLDNLPDGRYRINVTANDLALNATVVEHDFTIDNTVPSVQITDPSAGAFLDPAVRPFVLRGIIGAAHPQSYAWWIAEGGSPTVADFALVFEDVLTVAGEVEYPWSGPPPADGPHTIRLTVIDQLGRSSEDRRLVTIDSDPPVVEIRGPTEGAVITSPGAITGMVDDANLQHWTLEEVTTGGAGRVLSAGVLPADGHLATWDPLPEDGPVTLRLAAHDNAGHSSEVAVTVEVSVLPPGAPTGLTTEVVNGRDVELSWQPGPGPAPVGYHVSRNGVRLTASPLATPTFNDLHLLDGAYTYEVIAIGPLDRESDPSAPATVIVNVTPPSVAITAPSGGSRIGSEVAVYGTAFAADDFAFWEIAARSAGAPVWIVLDTATAPVVGGFMTNWITRIAPWADGAHELRLSAEDTFGNRAERVISVILDNSAPNPGPANLQAALMALDADSLLNDVRLSWIQSPSPADLAGFYLYRDGLLANAGGPIVGDPTPYLLTGTTFDDKDVADGVYTYGVAAADTAGNTSAMSNPAGPVTIDTRRPHAVITSPAHLTDFEIAIEIVVECDDLDVETLDLQYKLPADPTWTPVAPTFTAPPYIAVFQPGATGNFQVRALAADAVGPDPAPHTIQLNSSDLPPSPPLQVTARVAGDEVMLTWIAPPDPGDDLAGYEIVRDGNVLTADLLAPETLVYLDTGLTDRTYAYRVAAVDQAGQHGSSELVEAAVRTPSWQWVAPVTPALTVSLSGAGAYPLGTVEIRHLTPADGLRTSILVDADDTGAFEITDAGIVTGANTFTAASTDGEGNTSRTSLPLLIVSHAPPDQAADLHALAVGGDVSLSWTSSPPDPDGAGFEIRRDGPVINHTSTAVVFDPVTHVLNASDGDPPSWQRVVDGDPMTGWASTRAPTEGTPEWWSWSWPDPVEIDEVMVGWSQTDPPQVFDLDILTGGGWLWLARISWDGQPTMTVPAGITGAGVRVRLPMTGACGSSGCIPELTGMEIIQLERTIGTSYLDTGLPEAVYSYEVLQHNTWGQTSAPTGTAVSVGPAQPLPPTDPSVTATDCGGLSLQWQPAVTQPGTLIGHRIYRSENSTGPYTLIFSAGAAQTSRIDADAPIGESRHYVFTSMVDMGGIAVESQPSAAVSGAAECLNPPAPVITQPTVAGQPIQITPSQTPIRVRGDATAGSTVTLLHNSVAVATGVSSSTFTFNDVHVAAGSNSYIARQEIHGTVTDSAPIEVELDPTLLSDVSALSLVVTPGAGAPGTLMMAEGRIGLNGASGEEATFDVLIDVEDPSGEITEVSRTTFHLEAGNETTIHAPWTSTGPPGLCKWRLLVDPDDTILETDEDNNLETAASRMLAADGFELRVDIDRPVYFVGQQLTGEVIFASADPPADIILETNLEDAGGRLVAVLDSRLLPGFGPSWLTAPLDHPLIGLYPGLYRVRSTATITGTTVAESLAPIQLEQPIFVEAEVMTNRTSYPEGTPVAVAGRIHNLSPTLVTELVAVLSVSDATTGDVVAQTEIPSLAVPSGGSAEIGWSWPTSDSATGAYRAGLVVRDIAGATLAVAEPFSFTVIPGELRLAAEIVLSESPVEPGDLVTASVTVENTGATDLPSVDITLTLIDPVAMQVIAEHIHPLSLTAGASRTIDQPFDTSTLPIQHYVILVSAAGDDGRGPFDLDLSSATLELADLTPPTVVVIEPAVDGVACDAIHIEAEVDDTWSRVARVYHHLDGEPTAIPLHIQDPGIDPDLYSATRSLPPGPDGPHSIAVHAEDTEGNLSGGVVVSFDTDTIGPILHVSGPGGGSCFGGGAALTFSAVDANLASLTALLNGVPYTSGAAISSDGTHVFEATAVDACGREATEARTFVIDATAPEIVVSGITQGADVAPGTLIEWSVADLNLVASSATLDGAPVISPLALNTIGPHTLVVAATDCASNTTEVGIGFTVTNSILSLAGSATVNPAVLEPGSAMAISGSVSNLGTRLDTVQLVLNVVRTSTSIIVATFTETLALDPSQTHAVAFAPDTTGWALGSYEVGFAAQGQFLGDPFDQTLGTATVTLADLTAPQLTLTGPAPGLACGSVEVSAEIRDALSGVRAVTVSVDGGSPIPLVNTGGDIWSTALSLDDGAHHLDVIAVDIADNTTPPAVVDIDLDSVAPDLTVTAPDDDSCFAGSTTIDFSADDAHPEQVTATLNGVPISSGHVVDEDGPFHLVVTAVDACTLDTIDDREFMIDSVDPDLSVTGVADGEIHPVGIAVEWAAADDNLIASSATLDGASVDPVFTVVALGAHLLVVAAEDCAGNTTENEVNFETVLARDGLGGTLAAAPGRIEPPEPLSANAGIVNLTDTDYAGLGLRLEILDPTTGNVVDSFETTADLPPRGDLSLDHVFPSTGLVPGEHVLNLTAEGTVFGSAFSVPLATATFEVVDLTAPSLTVLEPEAGLVCRPVRVRAMASDTVSGVDSVMVHVNGDAAGLSLTQTGGGNWAVDLSVNDGPHLLEVVAADRAGNIADPTTVEIDLDTITPVLSVESPANDACLSDPATINFSAEDTHLDDLWARLDGLPINSGTVVAAEGSHRLVIGVSDTCGHSDTRSTDFIIDTTAPVITITGVSDGEDIQPPVEIIWTIDEPNLVGSSAELDNQAVTSGVLVEAPGSHTLVIEATDCAGNHRRTEIGFTVVEDPLSGLVIDPPELTAGGSILLLDRSPAGGEQLEQWLAGRAGRVVRVTQGCAFLAELRRAQHEVVVLYAPTGAIPLSTQACTGDDGLRALAAELSAMIYRRGGVLVLGEGMDGDGCLGCVIGATGTVFHDHLISRVDVEATTSIIDPGDEMTLFDLRPLDPAGSFPLLTDTTTGDPVCDGVSALTLTIPTGTADRWMTSVSTATPHEALDAESGELADGEELDDSVHPWVDLSLRRTGEILAIDLRSASGGAMPEWLSLRVDISAAGALEPAIEISVWMPLGCSLTPGIFYDLLEVAAVETIGHDRGATVAASAHRYGRGESPVLPWDVLAPANEAALSAVGQALRFSIPTEPRSAVAGLPLPISFGIHNDGAESKEIRLDASVPPSLLLDVWDDPISLDPVRWEFKVEVGESQTRTVWLHPTDSSPGLTIPYSVSVGDGAGWTTIETDAVQIDIEMSDRRTELRDLRTALAACAGTTDDPTIRAALRDLLAALERVTPAGDDRAAADGAIRDLVGAFAAVDDEALPCVADLRARLARLVAMWQAHWTATGGTL